MAIKMVKIRAEVAIGNLKVQTPYIQSFTVNKTRGMPSTFNASLKVEGSKVSGTITGDGVTIKAGENSANNIIFSGIVKKATISPNFDDPAYVILNIEGQDILSVLQGKKYTRRQFADETSWVSINSVTRTGLRSGKFKSQNVQPSINTINAEPAEGDVKTVSISGIFDNIVSGISTDGKGEGVKLKSTLQAAGGGE